MASIHLIYTCENCRQNLYPINRPLVSIRGELSRHLYLHQNQRFAATCTDVFYVYVVFYCIGRIHKVRQSKVGRGGMDAPKDLFQRFLIKYFHHWVNLAQLMGKKPIKRAQNDAEIEE